MRWAMMGVAFSLAACGGSAASRDRSEAEHNQTERRQEVSSGVPAYDLHEWGLISASPSGFEIAAGPGQRTVAFAVDKPVLYIHPAEGASFELSVQIDLGEGLEVVEHYPPAATAPLLWRATVGPHCTGSYPPVDDSRCPDGYCEVAELRSYESPDAACLEVGRVRAPLLFYRLRATGQSPNLPLTVTREGDALVVRNDRLFDVVGGLVRVSFDGRRVGVTRATLPAIGRSVRLARGTEGAGLARAALRTELSEQGLTEGERDAFLRAWDTALFGVPMNAQGGSGDGEVPVDVLTDRSTTLAGPRAPDALLYWLDEASIDGLARIRAEPAPRDVRRVYLVRVNPG